MNSVVKNKNKGFTLVELIVVIVILAILAAILVPALLGYIDRAKQQKGIQYVHDIQVAATAALVEYKGLHKDKHGSFTAKNYPAPSGKTIKGAYNISNYTFNELQTKNGSKNAQSDAIAKPMLEYLDSKYSDKNKRFIFKGDSPAGKNADTIAASGSEGLMIIFNDDCKIELIQYSDMDGFLYTYEAGQPIIVEKNGTFVKAN